MDPQGIAADLVASVYGFDRDAVDGYAVESQRRAAVAWEQGRFARSIVPVVDETGHVLLDRDEHLRPGTSKESLARLAPAFLGIGRERYDQIALARYPQTREVNHVHHAGNSSGVVDGAAAVLIGSFEAGTRLGLGARARTVAFSRIRPQHHVDGSGSRCNACIATGRSTS